MKSFVTVCAAKATDPLTSSLTSLPSTDLDEHHVSPKETPFIRLICGGLAGAIACTACYPIELVKTRLTVDKKNHYSGIVNTFTSVVRNEGFFRLYKGLCKLDPLVSVFFLPQMEIRIEYCSSCCCPNSCLVIFILRNTQVVHSPSPNSCALQSIY